MSKRLVFAGLMGILLCNWSHGADDAVIERDSGYFLTFAQKGELIWRGSMQDPETEDWYDVWICPGYVAPTREAARSWIDGADAFREYGGRAKYEDLVEDAADALEWGYDDSLWEFGIQGTGKAWKRHFSKANARAEKRVFGWWMAHPWALLQSSVETAARIPCGAAGAVLGTAWGIGVVPTWHLTNSAIKGSWYVLGEGVLLPVSAYAWNTVSAPPLALVGQRPAADRVDGFWVRRLTAEEHQLNEEQARPMGLRERDEIQAAALRLYEAVRTDIAEIAKKQNELNTRIAELRREYNEKLQALRQLRDDRAREVLGRVTGDGSSGQASRIARERIRALRPAIEQVLEKAGATDVEKREIYSLMHQHASDVLLHVRPKTDPVKTSVETIRELD